MLRKLEILLLLYYYSEFLTTPKYEISGKPKGALPAPPGVHKW